MKMLKTFFADYFASMPQVVCQIVWQLFNSIGVLMFRMAKYGRHGYGHMQVYRRRLKGEDEWQEQDWPYLGLLPPPGHPERGTYVSDAYDDPAPSANQLESLIDAEDDDPLDTQTGSAWKDVEPLVEKNNCCPGLENDPWFRIIEDDGCYIVLLHDGQVSEDHEDSWVIANWIFPEAFDELIKLPRPRGGIYEIGRDGPLAPDDGALEALYEQRNIDNEEDRAKIVERQQRKPS